MSTEVLPLEPLPENQGTVDSESPNSFPEENEISIEGVQQLAEGGKEERDLAASSQEPGPVVRDQTTAEDIVLQKKLLTQLSSEEAPQEVTPLNVKHLLEKTGLVHSLIATHSSLVYLAFVSSLASNYC